MEPKPAGRAEKVEKRWDDREERDGQKTREKELDGWSIKLCDELTGSLIGKQELSGLHTCHTRLFFLGLEFLQHPLPSYVTGARG